MRFTKYTVRWVDEAIGSDVQGVPTVQHGERTFISFLPAEALADARRYKARLEAQPDAHAGIITRFASIHEITDRVVG